MWPFLTRLLWPSSSSSNSNSNSTLPASPGPATGTSNVTPPIVPLLVRGASERDRIITPYRADAFRKTLKRCGLLKKYHSLPDKIRNGFPIAKGLDPITKTFTARNPAFGKKHMDFIRTYISEQVGLGRMSGPFTRSQVEKIMGSPFVSAPLSVVDKAGSPGKFRLIQNFSRPDPNGLSVNDQIDSDDFLTTWGTAAEVAQIVATAPPGAQAATLDLEAAFRTIPVLPDHKPFLVIQREPNVFFIDHVCPFGISSGTGVMGEVMDAIVDILEAHSIKPSKKWVDDLLQFRFPTSQAASGVWRYPHDLQKIFDITTPLGIPWKPGKIFDYSFVAVYQGYSWDLAARTVSLPDEKRKKYLSKVNAFINAMSRPVSQKDATSVNGTLAHICFVYPRGRAYLTNLTAFISSFPSAPEPRLAPQFVRGDMMWWRKTLSVPEARTLTPRVPRSDLKIWVAASTSWGIGVMINDKWLALKLKKRWQSDGRDIGWAVAIAVEIAVRLLEQMSIANADVDIHVHCDKSASAIVKAFNKGRSRNFRINIAIRRTDLILSGLNTRLILAYDNADGNPAGPLSCGKVGNLKADCRLTLPSNFPEDLCAFFIRK